MKDAFQMTRDTNRLAFALAAAATQRPRRCRFNAAPLLGAALALLVLGGGAAGVRPANAAVARAGEYQFYEPAPVGVLKVARPVITWKVWPVDDNLRVTGVALSVNGERVSGAAYSQSERAVLYACEQPLAPGSYTVSCQVVFNNSQPTQRKWTFTVAPDAVRDLPAPNAAQVSALSSANAFRRRLRLPDLRLDRRLCAAASAHSAYINLNRHIGHEQQAGRAGFVAARSGERAAVFGYAGGSYENVEYGSPTQSEAIAGLFDAPYHRIPFLQPGTPVFGAGFAGKASTLLFSATTDEATVCYPFDGQTDAPTTWDGNETPNPLAVHGTDAVIGSVGYPITFARFSALRTPIRVVSATLVAVGGAKTEPVAFWLNTPANDPHLRYAALLIPKRPLKPRATYEVRVVAQTKSGGPNVSCVWRFSTAGAPVAAPWRQAASVDAAPKL